MLVPVIRDEQCPFLWRPVSDREEKRDGECGDVAGACFSLGF